MHYSNRAQCLLCVCVWVLIPDIEQAYQIWQKVYSAVEKSAMHVQTIPPLSVLYNRSVDGWHHYRPCLCQSKNMVQDSNTMWHLCN